MNRFSNFMASCKAKMAAYWQSRSAARRVLLVCGCIVVVAAAVALINRLDGGLGCYRTQWYPAPI